MRRIRIIGLCLVAMFAFAVVATSSASAAEPEWGRCIAQKKGNYANGSCTTKSSKPHKGKYEWYAGAGAACYPLKHGEYTTSACTSKSGKPHKGKYEKTRGGKFTAKGGAGVLASFYHTCGLRFPPSAGGYFAEYHAYQSEYWRLGKSECEAELAAQHELPGGGYGYEAAIAETVECTNESATGEAVGTSGLANVSVVFNGCKALGAVECHSAGASVEEIRVNALKGRIGYIDKSATPKPEVGVLLEPTATGTTPGHTWAPAFAEFECPEIGADIVVGVGGNTPGLEGPYYSGSGHDGVISPITPVDEMSEKFAQKYTMNANYENVPSHFEGGQTEVLEDFLAPGKEDSTEVENEKGEVGGKMAESWLKGYAWSPAGQTIENENTTEGKVEIKA